MQNTFVKTALLASSALIASMCMLVSTAHAQSGPEYARLREQCISSGGTWLERRGLGDGGCDYSNASGSSEGTDEYTGPSIREIIQGFGERRRARATEINNRGAAFYRAGNYAQALPLYRQAFNINNDSPIIRINLMNAIIRVAYDDVQAARSAGNLASLGRIERTLAEVDRLNNGSLARDSEYEQTMRNLAAVRAHISVARRSAADARQNAVRESENARELAEASRRISAITEGIDTSIASERPSSRAGHAPSLGFGDPAVVQLNPGALTQEGRNIASSGPPRGGPVGTDSALGQLGNIAGGRNTIGQGIDGGEVHDDDTVDASLREIATPRAVRVLTAADVARYSAASPAFVRAHTAVERTRGEAEAARSRLAALEAQSARTKDSQTRQRIQIEISAATTETQRTADAQVIAENERAVIMQVIEGPAIIREGPPGAAPQGPQGPAPTNEPQE